MDRIGVRELRQHATRYLARVERGETLEVTTRGRPVARLVPVRNVPWDDLLSSGQLLPPSDDSDLTDESPLDYDVDASGRLAEMREDSR